MTHKETRQPTQNTQTADEQWPTLQNQRWGPAVEDDPPSGPSYQDVRAEVATWPIPDRERWGRLANDLADAGAVWPADEIEAFVQITGSLDCPAAKPQRPERVTAAELRAIDSSLSWAEVREILA